MKLHIQFFSILTTLFLLSNYCISQEQVIIHQVVIDVIINDKINEGIPQDQLIIYESMNDSIDLAHNMYDFSDSLLYIFTDSLIFSFWDTLNVHYVSKYWEALGDSIVLPLFVTRNQKYIHPFKGRVTSKFGPRRGRYHYGIDIDLSKGDTVVAAFDGIVRYTGITRGYGNVVVIRHFNGLETLYGHLSKLETEVGKHVFAGDIIGLGGNSGRSYGDHLHFEIRFKGVALNPQDIIDFENYQLKKDTLILYRKNFSAVLKNPTTNATTVTTGIPQYHTVRSGDTLGHIAIRYGTTVTNLCNLNNIRRDSTLRIGQKIRVR